MSIEFNEEQKKIIEHVSGPLLCIAGPGSGKTTSIIERVVHMTHNGVNPNNILVVTFTKAAAEDMKKKYERKTDAKSGVVFGTIHSFCFTVLRKYNDKKYNVSNIITDIEQRDFFRSQIKPLRIEWIDQDYIISSIIGAISNIKNNGVDPNSIEVEGCSNEKFIEIYGAYEDFKEENDKLDYDDMLFLTNKLFENNIEILDYWRDRYSHIIVDEFQDTNELQSKILYDLAYPRNNICIIGDDDQSIYMFRGAMPRIMLQFEKQYPNCTKVILNKNYRSEPEIVNATKKLIEHNKVRFDKPLVAVKSGSGKIENLSFSNRDREITKVIKIIKDKQREGTPLSSIAILYRTNNQAQQVVQSLIKADIPFYTYEMVINIYNHWIFRDIMLFKKVVDGTCTINEFLAIINRPNKFVSRKILPIKYSEDGVMKCSLKMPHEWQQKRMFEDLSDWYFSIHKMEKQTPYQFIETIRKDLKYDKFIEEYAEKNKLDKSQFFDVIDDIQESAEPFRSFDEWMPFVDNEIKTFKDKMKSKSKENSVTLSTMHRSKGLEWDNVIIIDANEDITPYYKAESADEMEEERRMFYVAATRAKENLIICSIEKRNKTKMVLSRFVEEMINTKAERKMVEQDFKSVLPTEFQIGNWVFHKTFGIGMVSNMDATTMTISFKDAGMKTLEKKWCSENLQLFNN